MGFVLGVGSERVIFDYLMTPAATGILAVDYDPEIITFHIINSFILDSLPLGDMKSYQEFRTKKSFFLWEKFIPSGKNQKKQLREMYTWWTKNIVENPGFKDFHHNNRLSKTSFPSLNYLYIEKNFRRIQKIAKNGNYKYFHGDLGDIYDLEKLKFFIQNEKIPVSVVDISNAWQNEDFNKYLGEEKTSTLLKTLNFIAKPEIMITTSGKMVQWQEDIVSVNILYRVFSWDALLRFISSTNKGSSTLYDWKDFYQIIKSSHKLTKDLIYFKESINDSDSIVIAKFKNICKNTLR